MLFQVSIYINFLQSIVTHHQELPGIKLLLSLLPLHGATHSPGPRLAPRLLLEGPGGGLGFTPFTLSLLLSDVLQL